MATDPPSGLRVERAEQGSVLALDGETPFHTTPARVRDPRLIRLPSTGTRLVLWSEEQAGAVRPFYAIGKNGTAVGPVKPTSYDLRMLHQRFDPLEYTPSLQPKLAAPPNSNLYIVQFVTQPLQEFRDEIRGLGGTVHSFLANHAQIVKMDPAARDDVEALPYVRWVGPYHRADRMEAFLVERAEKADAFYPLLRYNILVFEEAGKASVAQRIAAMGAQVDRPEAGKHLVEATLTPEQLFEVAGWDEVQFIDRWSPMETDMDIVRDMGGANYVETVAGYTGQGVRGEMFDTGFSLVHPDFAAHPLIEHGGPVGNDDHGTATAGVIFGDGTGDARARGLMPDGQAIVADHNNIGISGGTRYQHTAELRESPYFAVFQTSSVGNARTFNYTSLSAEHDTILFDWDVLHCQSQSNSGNQDSRPQAWAKNVVSGGAVEHFDTLTRDDDCWSCGSGSIGPAADGRIKPDLSFFYDATFTTYTFGTGYGEFGGTSGATPTICGHFGLFFQMWADGIFGNDVDPQATVFENRPHMTTAKAFMINTADQYPFTGTTDDLTRVHQGWGTPSVKTLYDMRDDISFIDETEILGNLESIAYVATVDPGTPAMRLTMTYADPAGNPAAAIHRVNDLTLKVTSPSLVTYWGNNGLLDGNWSTPGGVANTIDTVENVFVENPEAGIWTVEVFADEIVQDGHVETPELDADFALVVSGAFLKTCTSDGAVNFDGLEYACADQARIRVIDCDLNLDDNIVETVTVTLDSDSEPGGESVLLAETGPATARFEAIVPIDTTDAAGTLLVSAGDLVNVSYLDVDDGAGGANITKTDQATIDCAPPIISNIVTADVRPRSATVTFDTDEPATGTVRHGTSCATLAASDNEVLAVTAHSIAVTGLQDQTTYFYAVDAVDPVANAASDDNGGACYSFTTPEVPDFFTEQFTGDADVDFLRLAFVPDGSNEFYSACNDPITAFPTDPTGGTVVTLSDDQSVQVNLTGGASVSIYGASYGSFYISSNGYVTFGTADSDYDETLGEHFALPRVAALYDDLNPSSAGTVSWKQLSDRVVVTWEGVPEYSTTNSNDFQIEMFYNGVITINLLDIAAADGIVGLSEGNGLDPEFFESDHSGTLSCGGAACFDGVLGAGEERIDCGGPCPACQCIDDSACDDGNFCDGPETCNAFGACESGGDPCPGEACKEIQDICVQCVDDVDCDDGNFCNGVEQCYHDNTCLAGADACPWTTCDEVGDSCIVCDGDGICEPGEDCANCPGDCISGSYPVCGNGICEGAEGETCLSCPADCNGQQNGTPSARYCCGDGVAGEGPVTCADGRCSANGNTCSNTVVLAYCCGDTTCEDIEALGNCPADCTVPVPGEAAAGGTLLVTGHDPLTGTVSISFGVPCGAADHTIQYAELTPANLQGYNWAGQVCNIGAAGNYDWLTPGTPSTMFFVVVGNNGIEEGSYGKSSYGFERSGDTVSIDCPMVQNLQYTCD